VLPNLFSTVVYPPFMSMDAMRCHKIWIWDDFWIALQRNKTMQSSASSISSAGGNSILNDAFSSELIRGPVGSFAEDSPIRDRDSPNTSYRATYAMEFSPPYDSSDQPRYPRRQTQDSGNVTDNLFAKWSTRLPESNVSFGYTATEGLKLSPKGSPTSKPVITDWNDLLPRDDDVNFPSPAVINRTSTISPSKTTAAASKKLSMQDVFRSPPTHDLKKRNQLLSSPSFSFGGIDTPGVQSNGFSPVPEYPSDDEYGDGARKFSRLRFQPSFDDDDVNTDDEPLGFIPSFRPTAISTIPNDELEGVRRSPLQSSERKTLSATKRPPISDDPVIQSTRSKKSIASPTKSSKKKSPKKSNIDSRTPWTDANANSGNIRRVTMGEPQSSQSLADINIMMRRDQPNVTTTTKTPPKPKTATQKKSPPAPQGTATKRAKTPVPSSRLPPEVQSKVSEKKEAMPEQKMTGGKESQKYTEMDVPATQNEAPKEYSYPYRHSTATPQHYGAYPTTVVPPFRHDYHSRDPGRSQHVLPPVHYPPPPPGNLALHYAQPPLSSPHIPARYPDRRASSPAMPPGYALPTTPRFQGGFGVRNQSGSASLYSATHPRMSRPPPPFGWPIATSAASSRYSSPALQHSSHSMPSSARPTPSRPAGHLNRDKENTDNKSAGSTSKAKRNPCNCKKSRCLKLYCECFSAQIFCEGCNCADCYNTEGHYEIREKAMKELLHKNKTAFDVKTPGTIAIGCKCKRSECLKKYCEVSWVLPF
jgi:Tesmin/TSO1-like CXC domain, cysteine-rich domain